MARLSFLFNKCQEKVVFFLLEIPSHLLPLSFIIVAVVPVVLVLVLVLVLALVLVVVTRC